jgi:hypothetical protein
MQTLTPLPALTIPITPGQNLTLMRNVSAILNLGNREVIALSVISAVHELFGVGGTDYRSNHTQLRQDAQVFLGGFNSMTFLTGETAKLRAVLDWSDGHSLDATLSTNVDVLVSEMRGLRNDSEYILEKMYQFLQYLLPQ